MCKFLFSSYLNTSIRLHNLLNQGNNLSLLIFESLRANHSKFESTLRKMMIFLILKKFIYIQIAFHHRHVNTPILQMSFLSLSTDPTAHPA